MKGFVGVMGAGRCGSSAVAGALHAAGIPMYGDKPIGMHPKHNPKGHFEDRDFHRLNRILAYNLAYHPSLERETLGMYPLLDRGSSEHLLERYKVELARRKAPLWGMKCGMLGVIWPKVQHLFPKNRRMVMVFRDQEAMIQSRMKHSDLSYNEAFELSMHIIERSWASLNHSKESFYVVRYEELIGNTEECVGDLMAFLLKGFPDFRPNIRRAIASIDGSLNHHPREG